ncbi:slipin family protein [Marinobacter sp. CA1]|uniref:slipin family protein n=1 Tax=Marinobacter sp. CA1 TaxID=2817656 RepID=UPI001D0749A1|nr:slipin family protein [Marinobacter sp. CA1]MCG8519152.1 slipin family protein [Pseudomonadales bacterium]UDL05358.1 slipin family protein [Marinobacter sp. CA1]
MWKIINQVQVANDERVLVFRDRQFQRVLAPGCHRIVSLSNRFSFDVLTIGKDGIRHPQLDVLLKEDAFLQEVEVRRMAEDEVGVVYVDGELVQVLEPGERLVTWKDLLEVQIRSFPLAALAPVPEPMLSQLVRAGLDRCGRGSRLVHALVPDGHLGLLFDNGRLVQTLKAGRYGYWAFSRDIKIQLYDLRLQMLEVAGQEILTKDRVSLRINLNAVYQLADVEQAAGRLTNVADYIYKRLQLSLREVVGTRTLDELLADKSLVSEVIFADCHDALAGYGIALERVGVKDIILPGEMKEILNQVVQAQKAAEANLIQRREETAATRSLSNTAKMMDNNPTLLRLKELETLEKVADRIDRISVYGGLDSVMNDLVRLTDKPEQAPTGARR